MSARACDEDVGNDESAGDESCAQMGRLRTRAAIACGKNATARYGMSVSRAATTLAGVTSCIHSIVRQSR